MKKYLNIPISCLAVVSLMLSAGCKRQAQSDPVPTLTYELKPSISLIDGKLNLTPGLSWDNPTEENYKMVRETLISKDNVNFSRSAVFETAISSSSNGSDESRGPHDGIVSAYVLYTLLCEGDVVSREWRKVDVPTQTEN